LMNILRSPECAIGNINIQSQASVMLTYGRLGLRLISDNPGMTRARSITLQRRIEE
jgi:hypothetical protein